jgi:hypothetical protein
MTFAAPDASDTAYNWAWGTVAAVFLYYTAAAIFVHWRRTRSVGVTKYEPPPDTSPALAAFLYENGKCERAFAASIVSLAVKGFLEIQQENDSFTLKRLRETDGSLSLEESVALAELFPSGAETCKFSGNNAPRLCRTFKKFETLIEGIAELELMSSHDVIWVAGAGLLAFVLVALALPLPFVDRGDLTPASEVVLLFIALCIILGAYCLRAALRVWPATFQRLATYFPGRAVPKRALGWSDVFPVWLSAIAAFGFGLLAALTSPRFAVIVIACELLIVMFRHILYGPTAKGRECIRGLRGFREFLSRADRDRLNRLNEAGETPTSFDRYSAYAVAVKVEQAWGEEFAEDVLEIVQFHRALKFGEPKPASEDGFFADGTMGGDDAPIQLNLKARK